MKEPSRGSILQPGRNCWADAAVENTGVLIDARDYYRTFHDAARQAQAYLLIAGWRFSSDVRLLRGEDAAERGAEVRFLPFLRHLVERNPGLRIYVLAWDFSINYALEWELFQRSKFESGTRGRLQFRFDSHHAMSGSHHQKFVVIDGKLAFVGGLDFCRDDWDDRRHLANNPLRESLAGDGPRQPYHDLQAYLTGPAVHFLTGYFRERWETVSGEALALPAPPLGPPPAVAGTPLAAGRAALSLNKAMTLTDPNSVKQILRLYENAIAAAERLIYVENQYFSSEEVLAAFVKRMRAADRPKLDIALVLPRRLFSWIEAMAMEPVRRRVLEELIRTARDTGHQLGIYSVTAGMKDGAEESVLIHSKLLLVDDRFLTIGSANASNRSMGLDTELNVAWEAAGWRDRPLMRSIRSLRADLLAEHCGLSDDAAARERLARRRNLVATLDALADAGATRLRRLSPAVILKDRQWIKYLADMSLSYDPKYPLFEETLHGDRASPLSRGMVWFRQWMGHTTSRPPPKGGGVTPPA